MITPSQLSLLAVQGIGIDAAEITRFAHWHAYTDKKLSRLFLAKEIAYCRSCPAKSAERFAVRFAAREALYKALCQAYPDEKWLFLTLCKHVKITHGSHGQPEITVYWEKLTQTTDTALQNKPLLTKTLCCVKPPRILLSLTHTDTLAIAWVLVQVA